MKQTIKQVCGLLLFTLLSLSSYAQQTNGNRIIITGKVIDNTNLGMPGVNVVEKGTKSSAVTDIDGNYKISVNKGAVLSFAFIGMNKVEIAVGNQSVINVTMKDDTTQLADVVINVGYGTQKKNSITGAIATIKPADIEELPATNLSESLRGLVPGLSVIKGGGRPGDASQIQIRQVFGFSKDGSVNIPLIIIDDMIQLDPVTGRATLETFNRLDPSEIESLTVLKDGSAAIYGSRAAQGAIVVKTKRGKIGAPKFTYYGQYAINDAISHGKTMSTYDYGLFNNRMVRSYPGLTAGVVASGQFSAAELEQMKSLDYNWLEEAWKPALQQKHSLNVSGGTEKATYYAGLSYLDQDANLGDQKYERYTFRTGVDAKITDNLSFSASVSANTGDIEKSFTKTASGINDGSYGSKAKSGSEQADYGYLLHMPGYIPWKTTVDGKEYFMSPFMSTTINQGTANTNSNMAGWNYFAVLNNGSKQVSTDFSYNFNASLNYKIAAIKGLSVSGSFARSQAASYVEQIQLPFDLVRITNYQLQDNHLASAATPTFNTTANPSGEYVLETNNKNARVYYNNTISKNIQANFFATYARTFGSHSVDAMFSVERSEAENVKTVLAYDTTTGKDYLGTSVTAGTISSNSYESKGESGTLSYLGRLNYSYQSKYFLQFIFRSDASTKFAPENYWGFFPGLQAGWVVSNEDWFKNNVSWVDYFKLRYSVGLTGRDNVNPWRWQTYFNLGTDKGQQFGTNGGVLGSTLYPKVTANRNMTWDNVLKQNIGFDLNLLNNRLGLGFDYYYDKNTDMLISLATTVDVPLSVGGGFAEENFAAVNAWGSEFSINWNDKVGKDFSYNVGVNFGFSDNKVIKYPQAAIAPFYDNTTKEGQSTIFPAWGFKTWKETSTGDGILRTDEDITNYWNYLTANATAAGGTPSYLGITTVAGVRKGMLAYQDINGAFNSADGTLNTTPDGKIDSAGLDYVKLAKKNTTYGFTTNLGFKYKSFYFKTQISTSWGGYSSIDIMKQGVNRNTWPMWNHESYWKDMYDATDNVGGKYPSLAYYDQISAPSDFWQVSSFRCNIRNLTLGFAIPKQALDSIKIQSATLGITGMNLWDLYNPYPDHYRNMYDSPIVGYPTLRTWSLNLNVSF
ncbi:SusC/RagA family TonB-linked outer membrane protein [Flavobacterium alvei]|uniref:SusC/RagA family TonB-linked outer membrane protein n=1 Tax=Flavobacterium alvei TaxID=2080416 RepID=UPI0026F06AE2|nr:SusC/RagA family TonB-linked outer membrane protein [Flavobacterium alvei]